MELFALASAIGAVAVLLTTKAVNAIKPKSKAAGYAIAFGVSTLLVLASRFGGVELGLPNVSGVSWMYAVQSARCSNCYHVCFSCFLFCVYTTYIHRTIFSSF